MDATAGTAHMPRVLCIMGSGETTPTMVSVHADLLSRLGPRPVPAVLLDTPFGFQENAADISDRALAKPATCSLAREARATRSASGAIRLSRTCLRPSCATVDA